MKRLNNAVALCAIAALTATSASATMIIFDNNNGGTAKSGTIESATADNYGNPDSWGPSLGFTDFSVYGGRSSGDNLDTGSFYRNDVISFNVDQDLSPAHGGLGVCSEDLNCGGSSDSFSSNVNNFRTDEVLFFDFDSAVSLDTIWFNGDHKEQVNGSTDVETNSKANALFNIYLSTDGSNYTNHFANQVQPTGFEYITTGLEDSYKYFAIAASGWGQHSSYVEAISYTKVPEPTALALLGLGLAGLGAARRRRA